MNMIKETLALQTDRPIIPINPSGACHVGEVGRALKQGVFAKPDTRHPGFYEVEIGDNWYYLHVSDRASGVYLVAVEKTAARHCA
jgi:hypothetical protein